MCIVNEKLNFFLRKTILSGTYVNPHAASSIEKVVLFLGFLTFALIKLTPASHYGWLLALAIVAILTTNFKRYVEAILETASRWLIAFSLVKKIRKSTQNIKISIKSCI